MPKIEPEKKTEPEPETLKRGETQEILKSVAEKERVEKHERTEKQTKPKFKREIKKEGMGDGFLAGVNKYFSSNNINVVEQTVLRKTSEAEFIIKVPSAVGPLTYFCKAKGKKSINDGDLSSAYFQGQSKKMPVLFLTFGSLTKKAQYMLEKEFKGMHIKRI